MAEINSTENLEYFGIFADEEENCCYCVALAGEDGLAAPGTRISEYFDSLNAAFSARKRLLSQCPNAEVFDVRGVEMGDTNLTIH